MMNNDFKNRIHIGNDVKDYLKNYEYDGNRSFEEFWEGYHKTSKDPGQARVFYYKKITAVFSAVSVFIFLAAVLSGVMLLNRMSVIKDINTGKLFIISLSSGNPEFPDRGMLKKLYPANFLKSGDIIRTGKTGFCDIQLVGRALIRFRNNTEAETAGITDGAGKLHVRLVLKKGCLLVSPRRLKEDESFIIDTPSAHISVTGTRFSVEVDELRGTEVSVTEGKVKIEPKFLMGGNASGNIELNAGNSATIPAGGVSNIKDIPVLPVSVSEYERLNYLQDKNIITNINNSPALVFNSPEGSGIYLDGNLAGYAPLRAVFNNAVKISIRISKQGFEDYLLPDHPVNREESINPVMKVLSNSSLSQGPLLPGELAWEKTVSLTDIGSGAAVSSGRIYIPDGGVLKIFLKNGELIKSITILTNKGRLTRPVIDNGTVYIGSDRGGLYALSPEGTILWSGNESGKELYGAYPAASSGIVAVPSFDKGIMVYSKNGDLLFPIVLNKDEPVYSSPLILKNGSVLIYGTEKGNVAAVDLNNKSEIWKNTYTEGRILFPIIGDDETAVIFYRNAGSGGTLIVGVNPSDGSVKWQRSISELSRTTIYPSFSEGKAVFASNSEDRSYIFVLDARGGTVVSRITLNMSITGFFCYPGKLYIAEGSGKIYGYDINSNKMEWTYQPDYITGIIVADRESVYTFGGAKAARIIR